MRIFLIIAAILGLSTAMFGYGNDDYYLKTNKSFEVYGEIFRELTRNYVLDIDPEALMNSGINGMLSGLDPYTVFLDASEIEEIDVLTTGSYVGFGISVGTRDSMLTITGVAEGYSAFENGVRIGDRICRIDSATVLNEPSDQVRKFTRGLPNSTAEVWLLRDGRKDTLKLKLTRREIEVKNISYYGITAGDVGYIRIDRFSRYSSIEVKNALNEMKNKYSIKGLIIDLRNNPGGLLDAAVGISELFLPQGSPIVSTRGRNGDDEITYTSRSFVHDTTMPLVILINENSASASEIVAGAVQDQDRGIIVGKRSFGKGLVQTIIELPHRSSLKMTTAKYYTPSGRCIQRLEYTSKNGTKSVREVASDSVFFTKNGRPVYESKGIMPDSVINTEDHYSDYVIAILRANHIFNFANEYASQLDKLPENFTVEKVLLNRFKDYLKNKNYSWEPKAIQYIKKLKTQASTDNAPKETLALINKLEKQLEKGNPDPFVENLTQLKKLLDFEIRSRFLTESEAIKLSMESDENILTSLNLLKPEMYKVILSAKTGAKNNKLN